MDELRALSTRDGARLSYRRWHPEGTTRPPALILLHGAASNSSRWWHFTASTRLADRHLLLRPDLRGHGGSSRYRHARMERWCEDLVELMNAESQPQAVLVGHCLGANLAVHFAAGHPDRVAGLVLIEPMPRTALLGPLARLRLWTPLLRVLIAIARLGNRLGIRRRAFPDLDLQSLDRQFTRQLDEPGAGEALKARYASPRHDMGQLPFAQYLENLLQVVRPMPLDPIRCPVLVMLGSGHYLIDAARTLAALAPLPKLRVETFAAEHWIPTEQPDAMRQSIERFMDEVS